jgi:integrase
MRSTRSAIKSKAKVICDSWQAAENAARDGTLSTARAAEILNETLARCGQAAIERVQLGPWLDEWLAAKTSVNSQTQKRYKFTSRIFLAFLGSAAGSRFLDSINEADIRRFAKALKNEGRSTATVNRIMHDLGGAFGRAMRLGKIRYNPFALVELEKDQDRLSGRRIFTLAEVTKLVEASRGSDWQGLILLGYSSGVRLQDGSNLRWSEVDLEVGVISFCQRKTSRRSVIGLHPDFGDWLLRQSVPDDPQAFVFPELAGRPSSGKCGLSNQFNNIVRRVGIDAGRLRERKGLHGRGRRALSFHSLRHGAASNVFNAAAVKEVARRLTDHAQRGALDRYLHVDVEAIKSATALIPRLPL